MKIAIFIPSLAGGGAERVAVTLANEFTTAGHTTHLITATKASSKYETEINPKVRLHRLNATRTIFSINQLSLFLKEQQPNILLAIMDYAAIAAYIAVQLSSKRKKVRLFAREAISLEYKKVEFPGLSGRIRSALTKLLLKHTYRNVQAVFSPSKELAASIKEHLHRDINTIHVNNPVVDANFSRRVEQPTPEWPWDRKHKTIISAGRFTPQKDFICLLKAFKRLRKNTDCKLILLGEGPQKEILLDYIQVNELQSHCYLPGFVANPLPYFKAADVFVLSSRFEGSPNVLIQALACGTKAVSTDCPTGPAELLENLEYCKLVPVGDDNKLALAISSTLESSVSAAQENSARNIRLLYESRKIATKYLTAFDHSR